MKGFVVTRPELLFPTVLLLEQPYSKSIMPCLWTRRPKQFGYLKLLRTYTEKITNRIVFGATILARFSLDVG